MVHVSSSRPDKLSLQYFARGGLATTALRECRQGEARDTDGNGAGSVQDLAECAPRGQPQRSRADAHAAVVARAAHSTVSRVGPDPPLVMVSDALRDLSLLRGRSIGPFVEQLTGAQGRAQRQCLMGTRVPQAKDAARSTCPAASCS